MKGHVMEDSLLKHPSVGPPYIAIELHLSGLPVVCCSFLLLPQSLADWQRDVRPMEDMWFYVLKDMDEPVNVWTVCLSKFSQFTRFGLIFHTRRNSVESSHGGLVSHIIIRQQGPVCGHQYLPLQTYAEVFSEAHQSMSTVANSH